MPIALPMMSTTAVRGVPVRLWQLTAVLVIIGLGCGGVPELRTDAEAFVVEGKDSAGASIEVFFEGNAPKRARVLDRVLGTGEAPIQIAAQAGLQFTITFPVGVTIAYSGQVFEHADGSVSLQGVWEQHASGIFGTDSGTWDAPL